MSNIKVTHTESGLMQAQVARAERTSPHIVRVTLTGPDLERFRFLGHDQWVRLALPVNEHTRFDNLSDTFGIGGYLRYRTLPKATRPVIRNYTIRDHRSDGPDGAEVDIDFVVHGDEGVAGPWAATVRPGAPVALIDQGCGWAPVPADWLLLLADESGMPAVLGVLRDLPADARGHAVIELFDERDRQEAVAPPGVAVHWLTREAGALPGTAVRPWLQAHDFAEGTPYALAVGESALATGARRHLVTQRGVPKANVTFSGYWRLGRAAG